MSIRFRLFIFISVLVFSLSFSTIVLFTSQYRSFALSRLEETGFLVMHNLVINSVDHLFFSTYQSLAEYVEANEAIPDLEWIHILDRNNMVVASTDTDFLGLIIDINCYREVVELENSICFSEAVVFSGQKLGQVQLTLSKERMNESLTQTIKNWIFTQLTIFLIFLFIMYFSIRRTLSPLDDIYLVAEAISTGNFSLKVKESSSRELNKISLAMNSMSLAIVDRERKTREIGEYLACVINSISPALIGLDQNGTIRYWNNKLKDFLIENFYKDSNDLTGFSIRELPLRFNVDKQILMYAVKKSEPLLISNLYFNNQNMEQQIAELHLYPLDSNERKGSVLLIDNITEKRNYESLMVETEKMMTIGGMAAGMAHEINNPLAGIVQYSDLLKSRLSLENGKSIKLAESLELDREKLLRFFEGIKADRYLSYIFESSERISDIVRNMLDFSRHDDEYYRDHKIQDLVEQALKLSRNEIHREHSVDLRFIDIEKNYGDPELTISCHPPQIIQVLLNLLKNSASAMYGTNRTPKITIDYRRENNNVLLTYRDNGQGIPPEVIENLFTPFYTTKKKGEGTGLGMFISYHIIHEIHKGKISVESDGMSWTRFTLMLPLKDGEHKPRL